MRKINPLVLLAIGVVVLFITLFAFAQRGARVPQGRVATTCETVTTSTSSASSTAPSTAAAPTEPVVDVEAQPYLWYLLMNNTATLEEDTTTTPSYAAPGYEAPAPAPSFSGDLEPANVAPEIDSEPIESDFGSVDVGEE